MTGDGKVVIIGLDGVPFGMLEDFAASAVMPNTQKLISQGIFRKTHSTIPEVSCVAWSSIITGANPGGHGIFGFMDLHPDSYRIRFPNFNDLKARPFWETWDGPSVIINVPATYPVRKMNGVLISGFVSIEFEKSVYPGSLINPLKQMDYRLDVDSQKGHTDIEGFLADLKKTLEAEIEAYRYLWDKQDWRTFMLVFTTTDRLMHFLWNAYEDKQHKYHDIFLEHFRRIDEAVGEILGKISDDDLVVMLSDHGFGRLEKDVFISYVLAEEGILRFKQDQELSLENICFGTKAFVLDPARIYINYKGKYPFGTVEPDEAEEVLSQLEEIFRALEVDGKKVVRDIYRKSQVYQGPYTGEGPDLILVGAEGFNLKATVKAKHLTDKPVFSGKHTQDDAFLIVRGLSDESIVPEVPVVWDIKAIVEKAKGWV
jgi:predicted AlkP superfamily phosphohydrolase/phosphomutase